MAQKTILSWVIIPNRQETGSDETETSNTSASEPATEPGQEPPAKKQKFEHSFQEKWLEKWPFLRKTEKGMFCQTCINQKKKNTLTEGCTNYRTSTIDRHLVTQDHQDALREEALRKDYTKARICY